jgi:hypothetical protein
MLAKVTGCALVGLEGVLVDVEVDTSRGMPSLIIVGLYLLNKSGQMWGGRQLQVAR